MKHVKKVSAISNDSTPKEDQEVRRRWNEIAKDWNVQVGKEGDSNRLLNSDPVLWRFCGSVRGLRVLDAGCGTGYLSCKLHEKGAEVTGVDVALNMVNIARENAWESQKDIDFTVDSCSKLETISASTFDLVISNYVLMDLPDLEGAANAFYRVLKPEGHAILIFSHPCFPQGKCRMEEDIPTYPWDFPYFKQRRCEDPPWGHFSRAFIWYHRPLSDYWKAFKQAGFEVVDFEEPRNTKDRHPLIDDEVKLRNSQTRPYSVAFKLKK